MEHEEWKPNQPNQTCYGCLIAQRVILCLRQRKVPRYADFGYFSEVSSRFLLFTNQLDNNPINHTTHALKANSSTDYCHIPALGLKDFESPRSSKTP
jgi:hypothetical protein